MNFEKLNSIACRIFFVVALFLLAVAVIEKIVNVFDYTILGGTTYVPSRLLEFSTILVIFVIALVIRQVREELRKRSA
jgi:hypothetical protein